MDARRPDDLQQPHARSSVRGRFHWPTFAADAVLVTGGALLANVLNYIFHFTLSRRLGPDGYGALATLLAIAMIAGVIGSSVGTLAMQETARLWALHLDDRIGASARRLLRPALALGAGVALVALALAFPLSRFLHITDARAWTGLVLALFTGIVAAYARGAVQGAHRFVYYSASLVVESAIKLGLGFALVAAGYAVGGAMLAVAIGLAIGVLVAYAPFFDGGGSTGDDRASAKIGGAGARLTVIYACSMALLFVDTVFAKHALSGTQAGYYTAAGLIARIVPFGVGLLVPLITPKAVAASHTSRGALAHLLAVAFGIAIAGTAIAFVTMELLPRQLIGVTFGASFAPAASLLRLYAADTSLLALGLVGYSYLAAVGEYGVTIWLVAAVIGEASCMAAFGTTPARLLGIAIVGNALVLPVIAAFVGRTLGSAPQAPSPLPAESITPVSTLPEFPQA